MQKRGQTSIFILVGLILLIIVGFSLLYTKSDDSLSNLAANSNTPSEILPIKNYVEQCIAEKVKASFEQKHLNNAYFEEFFYLESDGKNLSIPYYFFNGKTIYPTNKKVESIISESSKDIIDSCFDMSVFTETIVVEENFKIDAQISGNELIVSTNRPISLVKNERRIEWENFQSIFELDFLKLHSKAKEIADLENGEVCIDCIGSAVEGLEYEQIFINEEKELGNAEVLINYFSLDNYDYFTAHSFYSNFPEEKTLLLGATENIIVFANETSEHDFVVAEGSKLYYEGPDWITVSDRGLSIISPGPDDEGTYVIYLNVGNEGRSAEETFLINVTARGEMDE